MIDNLYLAATDSIFPPINATLNAISATFLLTGFILIKQKKEKAHRVAMIGALICSTAFLTCYLYYHYTSGHTTFPAEYPVAKKVYLTILIPHIILAVVNLPLIIITVIAAIRGNFVLHKKIAKVTFPVWMFVSVTGVIVYFMVYQWFVPTAAL